MRYLQSVLGQFKRSIQAADVARFSGILKIGVHWHESATERGLCRFYTALSSVSFNRVSFNGVGIKMGSERKNWAGTDYDGKPCSRSVYQ
jgi:hypothetical protein